MASSKKKVTLDVAVKTEQNNIDALEKKLDDAKRKAAELKQQKIEMKIDADTKKLEETHSKIEDLKNQQAQLTVGVDDDKIDELQSEIEELNGKAINLEANVEKGKVDALALEVEELNGKTVTVNTATDSSGLDSVGNKLVGIAGTIGMVDQATQMWEASTARQSQQYYLAANLGTEQAQKMQREIQNIVSQVPGDDTFMNQLMTTALAQNTKMTTDELKNMARVAADYMAGSKMMGKMNLESQQDIYKYLLDGNTAELERGSILSSQVDKLKNQETIQERIKAINEALQAMGYSGISGYDTAANNLEEFQGRLEKARADWGDVFLPLEQGALKAALALDDKYGGALAMAITGTQALVPTVISGVSAFGEFHRGVQALKETRIGEWAGKLKGKITGLGSSAKSAATSFGSTLKDALVGAANAAKSAVTWLARVSKELLVNAANALRSAAAWAVEKAAKLASEAASKLAAAAQWLLNAAMSANPITLIIIALVALVGILWYLYNTCEPVHDAIDGIWAGVSSAIQPIVDSVQWLIDKLTQLANGDWSVTIDIMKAGVSAGVDAGMDMANNDLSRGIVGALMGDEALTQVDEQMPAFKEKVSTSINEMLDAVWNDGTQGFLGWLGNIAGIDVGSYLTGFQTSIGNIPQWVNQAGQGAIQGFKNMYDGAAQWLNNIITQVASFVSQIVPKFASAASQSVNNFINGIRQMPGMVAGELDRIWQNVVNWGQNLANKFSEIGGEAYNALKRALGIGSPGYMFYMMESELGRIEHIMENNEIPSKAEVLGKNLISAWNNPQLDLDGEFSVDKVDGKNDNISSLETLLTKILEALSRQSGNTYQFTLNGDVDNEERMQKFLDAVRRELEWNNATAGRSVIL